MNHHELLTLIQSCQAILTFLVNRILTFLVNRGLVAARRRCSCGNQMVLRDDKSDDGYHRECPVNQCRKRRSIRAGSFFEDSKIPLLHWLYIIFLWSIDESNKEVSPLTGLSLCTVITALQRLRDICSFKNSTWQLEVGRPRKNDRDRRVHVWPQTQVQPRAGRSRHVGFRYGPERHWTSSGIPRTKQDKRNLGDWTSTGVCRAWNNNNLQQVFAILQPEQYRLHTPHG